MAWPGHTGSRGSANAERFGGDPDQAAVLARARASMDWTVERLAGWITYELAGHPGAERARAFLLTGARADLESAFLIFYSLGFTTTRDEAEVNRMWARLLLVERGYLEPDEAARSAAGAASNKELTWRSLRRRLAREMGIDRNLSPPNELEFLRDEDRASASLDRARGRARGPRCPDLPPCARGGRVRDGSRERRRGSRHRVGRERAGSRRRATVRRAVAVRPPL